MKTEMIHAAERIDLKLIECVQGERCSVCGGSSAGFRTFAEVRGWHYAMCEGCGLVFLDPCPTLLLLEQYYNSFYRIDIRQYRRSVDQQKQRLLSLVGRYRKPPGRLLEVGCSYGYFLAAAREVGWQVEGIELSREAAVLAEREQGIRIVGGTLEDAKGSASGPYDVIVAWHVIEHLTDPCQFLREAFDLLAPGGTLALRTPNLSSAVAKLAGVNWEWLSPPDHIYLFDPGTLGAALSRCGFESVQSTTARGDASNPCYEILRSWGRRLFLRQTNTQQFSIPVPQPRRFANRGWYRATKRSIEMISRPLDWSLWPWLADVGKEAEVVMVSRKPAGRKLLEDRSA
jgi:SAM-dependent methyltransferase